MRRIIDSTGITVMGDGGDIIMISAGDPEFTPIRDYLVGGGDAIDYIRDLAINGKAAIRAVVNDAVAAVDGDAGGQYRIMHGDPVDSVLLATAVRVRREGSDLAALGAFAKRLEANPSPASRSQLFAWLAAGGFTLTRDGMIVGYKGVGVDGRSLHSGRETVTITHQDGRVETVCGKVPYPVGATVSMQRLAVDDDRDSPCSVGLHVGTFEYANNFGANLILVLVDPADVVAVPRDYLGQKMRVCRLTVAATHDGGQITDAVLANVLTVPDAEAEAAYRARPENQPPALDHDDVCDDDEDDFDGDDHCRECSESLRRNDGYDGRCNDCIDRLDDEG